MQIGESGAANSVLTELHASGAPARASFSRSGKKVDVGAFLDRVEISSEYRSEFQPLSTFGAGAGVAVDNNGFEMARSTKDVFAGASVSDLRNYLRATGTTGDIGLAGIAASRETLGRRIDSVIKNAGIELAKDEKISVSIAAGNKIKVGGIKDKNKAKAIEKALNDDLSIGQEIRRHFALAKTNDNAKKQNDFALAHLHDWKEEYGDLNDMFTNRGLRAFVIDDYIREKTGQGLADLSLDASGDKPTIRGVESGLATLFAEDQTLAASVANILENGEQNLDFAVSFEFANGAITDSGAETAAKEKVKSIQQIVIGLLDEYNEKMAARPMAGDDPETLSGFSIRVRRGGGFEIVGAEDMDPIQAGTLRGIVDKALFLYEQMGIDSYTAGVAKGTFADIAATFIESHRFEHGDVDEFQHEVEIGFSGFMTDIKVVSEEADKAREAETQKVADDLGKDLRGVLEAGGVNVGDGIEIEMDEHGKLKVVGDLSDPNLKLAQTILDRFAKEAMTGAGVAGKGTGGEAGEGETGRDVNDSLDILFGKKADGAHRDEFARREAANRETNPGGTFSPNVVKQEMPEFTDRASDTRPWYQATADALKANIRDNQDISFFGGTGKVSGVRQRRFASPAANGAATPGAAFKGGTSGVEGEAGLYADDPKGKYLRILDSFGQFHDGGRGRKFRFLAA